MKCPKCGYLRQPRDHVFAPPTECPACGIVYSKYGANDLLSTEIAQDISAMLKKPSPVHEDSLKQARERVERRLRKKKYDPYEKDEFREQTLQRARLFVSEGIKRRQEEWQRQKMTNQSDLEAEVQDTAPSSSELHTPASRNTPYKNAPTDSDESIHSADAALGEPNAEAAKVTPEHLAAAENGADALDSTEQIHAAAQNLKNDADDSSRSIADDEVQIPMKEQAIPQNSAAAEEEEGADVFTMGAEVQNTHRPDEVSEAIKRSRTGLSEETDPSGFILSSATEEALPIGIFNASLRNSGSGLMRLLPIVAWLILVAGVVGAVLSWTTLSDVQAGMNAAGPAASNNLPVALLLGFAYLATGVLGFAFFWVSSMINSQLKDIRRLLLQPPRPNGIETSA